MNRILTDWISVDEADVLHMLGKLQLIRVYQVIHRRDINKSRVDFSF